MIRFNHTFLAALAVALSMAVALALAAGPEQGVLPQPDPLGKWHTMTLDPATTTSQCVGDTRTVLCTIDTVEACILRAEKVFCDQSMLPALAKRYQPGRHAYDPYVMYRVVSARRALKDRESLGADMLGGRYVKSGDVLIEILRVECNRISRRCEPGQDQPPRTYIVRKVDMRWLVVAWDDPRW